MGAVQQVGREDRRVDRRLAGGDGPVDLGFGGQWRGDEIAERLQHLRALGIFRAQRGQDALQGGALRLLDLARFDALQVAGAEAGVQLHVELGAAIMFAQRPQTLAAGCG